MTFKNQREMFIWIWETRPHISEVSGDPLLPPTEFKWHWQFAHILPKGTYSKFRLNPNNVMLMTPEEHAHQEDHKAYHTKKEILRAEYRNLYEIKKL